MKHGVYVAGRLPDDLPVPNVSDHDFEPAFVGHGHLGGIPLSPESIRRGLEIAKRASGEVVQNTDGGPSVEQSLDEMGADEPAPPVTRTVLISISQRVTMAARALRNSFIALRVSTTSDACWAIIP